MKLKQETKDQILALQKQYPHARSALIPALHLAQNEIGFLPQCVQKEVAVLFNLELNEVNSIVTFYDMFFEEPVGKHVIHFCKNLSCMLRGSDEVMKDLENKLGIKGRATTEDKEFTLIPAECLGACDRAPMMLMDDLVVGPIESKDLDRYLAEAKQRTGHHG